jgi:MinD-like ATPase involved in chromosome partitioning or flagellar assembly
MPPQVGPQPQQPQQFVQQYPPAPPAAPRRGRVIAVASAKGGVGKTSAAVNLSVYAARILQAAGRPGTAVIVDTNFQQADVARYLNLQSPTILDLFRTSATPTPETVRGQLAQVPGIELYALLGPPDAVSADPALINSALYRRILPVLRQAFDFVFVDTPVAELYHVTFTDLILPEADAILVPVEPNRVTLEAARSWLKAITMPQLARGGGVAPDRLSLILNRARADVDCGPEEVMDLMPGWRFVGMIPEDQEWMQAVNTYQLTAMSAGSDLEATFRGILQAVTGDPVFETARIAPQSTSRWRSLLGLHPK